jgi:hypothetical protein
MMLTVDRFELPEQSAGTAPQLGQKEPYSTALPHDATAEGANGAGTGAARSPRGRSIGRLHPKQ